MQLICLPLLVGSGALTKLVEEIGVAIHSLGLQRSIRSARVKLQRDKIGFGLVEALVGIWKHLVEIVGGGLTLVATGRD